jgi:DegV family protein with EDD domain
MSKIAIVTDSSALLPSELVVEHAIRVVPLTVLWGSETYLDGVEITPLEFYQRLAKDPHSPSTTQPTPDDFMVVFEKLASEYEGIVAPLLSSELSGTVNSAQLAAEQFGNLPIRIVDTRSTAMGLGLAVLAAARAAEAGASIDAIEKTALKVADSAKVLFVVDTLEYLHRGGRIGGASRFFGTALGIKPLLHLADGRVDALERVRTKRKAVDRMLELAGNYVNGESVRASVMHANALVEAQTLKTQVEDRFNCTECFLTELSPVITAHVGPGTVALAVCPNGALPV